MEPRGFRQMHWEGTACCCTCVQPSRPSCWAACGFPTLQSSKISIKFRDRVHRFPRKMSRRTWPQITTLKHRVLYANLLKWPSHRAEPPPRCALTDGTLRLVTATEIRTEGDLIKPQPRSPFSPHVRMCSVPLRNATQGYETRLGQVMAL